MGPYLHTLFLHNLQQNFEQLPSFITCVLVSLPDAVAGSGQLLIYLSALYSLIHVHPFTKSYYMCFYVMHIY